MLVTGTKESSGIDCLCSMKKVLFPNSLKLLSDTLFHLVQFQTDNLFQIRFRWCEAN